MMPDAGIFAPDEMLDLAQGLFPTGVVVELAYPWNSPNDLYPDEAACLPAAIDKRLGEFAAGRRAARAAMVRLGHKPQAILHQADRSPLWPQGLAGSISHTSGLCLAALTRASDHPSLGLDIEEDAALTEDMIRAICTPSELAWLSMMNTADRARFGTLIFSAKECAYKLQYPLTGEVLEFGAFDITLDPHTCQFEATFTRDVAPFHLRDQIAGRFAFGAGLVMTGAALGPDAIPADTR